MRSERKKGARSCNGLQDMAKGLHLILSDLGELNQQTGCNLLKVNTGGVPR